MAKYCIHCNQHIGHAAWAAGKRWCNAFCKRDFMKKYKAGTIGCKDPRKISIVNDAKWGRHQYLKKVKPRD